MNSTTQDKSTTISYLGWVLQNSGYQTTYIPDDRNPDQPYEQLLVQIGQDKKGREVVVRLLVAEEILQAISQIKKENTPRSYGSTLQFLLWLPGASSVNKQQESDLALLLNRLNNTIPLGIFGYNETDGIHLRYAFYFNPDGLDPRLVEYIVSTMGYLIGKYRSYIDALLEGRAPLEAIIAKLSTIEKKAGT